MWEYKPGARQSGLGGSSFLPQYSRLYYPHTSTSSSSLPPYRLMMATRRRVSNGSLVTVEGVGTPVEEGGVSRWRTLCRR